MSDMHVPADLPCLPESRLPASLLAQLPERTPAPPWDCRVRAVLWAQRAPSPLPSSSRYAGRARAVTVGAVVEYLDSPVGPYAELLAGPLLRGTLLPVVHVPFIAVDSLPSVQGGRAHWALPKTVASFTGGVDVGRITATGEGWSVSVDARPRGPRLPLRGRLANAQDGRRAAVSLRGTGRVAAVDVTASGVTLSGWLGTGRRPALVVEGQMLVQRPR